MKGHIKRYDLDLSIRDDSRDLDAYFDAVGNLVIAIDENDRDYTHDFRAKIFLNPDNARVLRDYLNEVLK